MPIELVAELATGHGGDVGLAEAMLHAAAEAGATTVKTQAYSLERLNPRDPQADWLRQSCLPPEAHERLMAAAQQAGVNYLVTPFDGLSLRMLREIGLTRFKIASSESRNDWWQPQQGEEWYVSFPWGKPYGLGQRNNYVKYHFTAIPLYPTPLEAVGRAEWIGAPARGGWSDHCEGISACLWAITRGMHAIEVHFKIDGKGRNCPWDKSADDLKRLRAFADDVETMTSGVATKFRERWSA